MNQPLPICDLDGTLIDSFPSVAEAIRIACSRLNIACPGTLSCSILGPLLMELLRDVTGITEPVILTCLRRPFVGCYDNETCRLTTPFAGVEGMLSAVRSDGCRLAIATNKRLTPTTTILQSLRWTQFFHAVETVDSKPQQTRAQKLLLRELMMALRPGFAAYLGHTNDDILASGAAGLPCIFAGWGYGTCLREPSSTYAESPKHAAELFRRLSAYT